MTATAETEAPSGLREEALRRRAIEERVLLLSPTVGRWEGRYKLPSELISMSIGGERVDTSKKGTKGSGITTPHTVLLTDEWPLDRDGIPWKKRFAALVTVKDKIIAKYSVPFQAVGARIIPKAKGVDFFDELIGLTLGKLRSDLAAAEADGRDAVAAGLRVRIRTELEADPLAGDATPLLDEARQTQSFAYRWKAAADEFCRSWDDVRRQIREHLRPASAWQAIQGRLPKDAAELRAKFYTSIMPVELAGGGSQYEHVTAKDLADYRGVVEAACRQATESAIESLIAGPREELAAALAGLQDVIGRDGRVTTRSFHPVEEAIAKLRLFGFAANEQILSAIDALEHQMGRTQPSSLNSRTAAQSGFNAALEAVVREVEDAQQMDEDIQRFGRHTRAITFR